MENWQNQFLSDLTTSEGQLTRFTQICHALRPEGKLRGDRLAGLTRERVGLTNIKVIRRHIRVMEVLNLIDYEDGLYSLSSEGRALWALTPGEPSRILSLAEKILYLRSLAIRVPIQFTSVLTAISENTGQPREHIINSYGKRLLNHLIPWKDAETIRFRLSKEPPSIPRKLQNNFDCLLLWLKQMGLVDAKRLRTTKLGEELARAQATQGMEHMKTIYRVASAYVCGEPGCLPEFDYQSKKQRERFLSLFNDAYALFELPELRVSDVVSMRLYVCIKLMVEGHPLLDELSFGQLIRTLSHEGTIQSVMTGRNGKLAYISLGAGDK